MAVTQVLKFRADDGTDHNTESDAKHWNGCLALRKFLLSLPQTNNDPNRECFNVEDIISGHMDWTNIYLQGQK